MTTTHIITTIIFFSGGTMYLPVCSCGWNTDQFCVEFHTDYVAAGWGNAHLRWVIKHSDGEL